MTANQINYWRNQEEIRANKEKEAELYRSHLASERVAQSEAISKSIQAQAARTQANVAEAKATSEITSNYTGAFEKAAKGWSTIIGTGAKIAALFA